MNSLSWFLYLADVVSGLGHFFSVAGFLFLLFGGWLAAVILVESCGDVKWPFVFPVVGLALLLFATLIPSKNTIYAIAASELGKQAAESELGKKGLKAVELWIDEQMKEKKQ